MMIGDVWRNKRSVTRDIEDRLYSKVAYLFTKVKLYSFLMVFEKSLYSRNSFAVAENSDFQNFSSNLPTNLQKQ